MTYLVAFFTVANKIYSKLQKTTQRIKHIEESQKNKTLFNSDQDKSNELIFKVKDDLRSIPDNIVVLVNKGAKLNIRKELVKNISLILKQGMISQSNEFRKVLEMRSRAIQKEAKKINNLGVSTLSSRRGQGGALSGRNQGYFDRGSAGRGNTGFFRSSKY